MAVVFAEDKGKSRNGAAARGGEREDALSERSH